MRGEPVKSNLCQCCQKAERTSAKGRTGYNSKYCNSCRNRLQRYKLSPEELRELMEKDVCDLCRVKLSWEPDGDGEQPCIDHCHETGKIRGVLCNSCNLLEGMVDDPIRVLLFLHHLEKYRKNV